MKNDPNGYAWHEPKCETCGTFDANCDCTRAPPDTDKPKPERRAEE